MVLLVALTLVVGVALWSRKTRTGGPATTVTPAGYLPLPTEPVTVPEILRLQGVGGQAVPFAAPLDHARSAHLVHEGDGRFVVRAIVTGQTTHELVAVDGHYDGAAEVPSGPDEPVDRDRGRGVGAWRITIR